MKVLMRSIVIEVLKLKRRRILILCAGAIIFTIVTSYLPSISTGVFGWQELLSSSIFMLGEILFLLFSYIAGTIFAGEYENNTIEPMLSAPVSITEIVFGKSVAIAATAGATMITAIALTLFSGVIFRFGRLPGELFGRYTAALVIVILMHLCYIPAYVYLSVSTKKTIFPSVFGMAMVVVMMIFAVADYAAYIPPCYPVLIQVRILGTNAYTDQFLHARQLALIKPSVAAALLAAVAILPVVPCRRFYRRF